MIDPVTNPPGAAEIGFTKAAHANCAEILWQNLARNPEARALTGPAGDLTYAELIAKAAQWGHAFAAHGLAPGDRIALFLDDTPSFPAAFFGATRAGFVPVLLNTMTPPELLAFYLTDSGAPLAVTEPHYADRFPKGAPVITDHAAFTQGRPTTLDAAPTGPDDMAFWMYSSGSTGRPKGIVHLHHDMAYSQASFAAHVLHLRHDDVCFSVPKAYFAYGFGNSITFPFAIGACTLLMPDQPKADAVLDMIEAHAPTVFFGLPTLYTALINAPGVSARDLSSLRQCMSAAEILSEDVANRWKALTGLSPIEGLGSTEMLHVYLSNTADDMRHGAAGKRVPGYEIELREGGVMFVRGHSSAPAYWNRPDKTAETMQGDWINTGDRFEEREGFYYFQGRADDLVKVSGQWVWPLEVERALNEHPEVHESAVLAHELPDRRMTLSALVSLRSGPGDAGAVKMLQDHVKSTLLPYKYPRQITFVKDLPKTGTGKIDRQAVKSLLQGNEKNIA
ncbi:benzoate-CoA ligase family protein [Oceanicola sp. 502str15]|uniref:benzoate-CoA ligase family protein n=1 Tax=Oceanicola sp. 502str15 TaxID=2696061 RepID=UPI0020940502|nr:benzoate-CoA ligase family protein [Oceanicola sp. 502str15]